MIAHKRFKFSTIGDVRTELEKMKIYLPLADDTAILQQPLHNRFGSVKPSSRIEWLSIPWKDATETRTVGRRT
jgi:hypothetical protein